MPNTHSLIRPLGLADVIFRTEPFPLVGEYRPTEFSPLFDAEGKEIRGKALLLNWRRYRQIQQDDRLAFISARLENGRPIGYASGYVYIDLHWSTRVACDDLWYVVPEWRGKGVGCMLKFYLHDDLRKRGADSVQETIRAEFDHPQLMASCGYELVGHKWSKRL